MPEERIYSNEFEQEYAQLGLLREEPCNKRKLRHYFDEANGWDREMRSWESLMEDITMD